MKDIEKIDNELSTIIKLIHQNNGLKSFVEDIPLITLNVAGLYYAEDIDEIFPKLEKGDKLNLFREPHNKYDKYAILVKYQGQKIGYVPRADNKVLANLMDAGKEIYGIIVKVGSDSDCEDEIYYNTRFVRFKIFLKEY